LEIKSINIFGITGGIGSSFVELSKESNILINGYYHRDVAYANSFTERFPNVQINQIDLSNQFVFDSAIIPNYEGLLFVVGQPHFSKNIFDFEFQELRNQININIFSLLAILKSILSYNNCSLKKVVLVLSELPNEIRSIYHLTKILQEQTLEILCSELNNRNISISAVKVGWVNTKMYNQYKELSGIANGKVVSPDLVAAICKEEFENSFPLNLISI